MRANKTTKKAAKDLDPFIEICTKDASQKEYFHGMANGLIFAKSVLNGKEPQYIDPPKGRYRNQRFKRG